MAHLLNEQLENSSYLISDVITEWNKFDQSALSITKSHFISTDLCAENSAQLKLK